MIRDPQILRAFLATHPEAWPVRMALIEELVRDGKSEEARLVIRESPVGSQMPREYQSRIHTALTRGAEGVNSLTPLLGFEERSPANSKPREDAEISNLPVESKRADLENLSPGSRALTESGSQLERGKSPPPVLAPVSEKAARAAAPIMQVASPGKPPLSGDDKAPRSARRPPGGKAGFSDHAPELSRAALVFVGTVLLFGVMIVSRFPAMARKPWKTINGDLIVARAVEFDLKTKMVTWENPGKKPVSHQSADLDFASQQRLFFSSAFQKTQLLDGVATWSPEKANSYAFLLLFATLLIIGGMWVTGLVIARRRNPLVAAITCGTGWLTGSILMVTYSFIAERTAATGVMWFGAAVSLAIVALLVSALYQVSYIRGLLIFVCHAVLVGMAVYVLVFHAATIFPNSARQFWHQTVFVPTGLVVS